MRYSLIMTLLLTAAVPLFGGGLTGTAWLVEDIGRQGVIDYAQTTMRFQEDGNAAGSTGCNQYRAGVTMEDTSTSFGMAMCTRKACAPAVMDQEQRFLAALPDITGFRIDDNGLLFLLDAEGREVMRLSRMDTEAQPAP